ncbi:glycoside hydrolase family 2 protein [Arthrobacter tumbae]|uniref:glycoside hydrolase family 2 protein n=1 Tax=Arthrobacter tumbae TaxID=163874 RepID=UPI0027DB6DF5|nr:glycoside hydrolase family 2 protein [Arthrobacter tumbae]MBM7781884.1 beta-mannosidase [Arthrobacter tumbae]
MTVTSTDAGQLAKDEALLHENWHVEVVKGPVPEAIAGRSIPATVPGSIHTDLMAAGLIEDPYLDDNERLLAWIGLCDWRYSTSFQWRAGQHQRTDLVFEGLDTVAVIELNGERVGETANMHRTYRFDVRALLREGSNDLTVTFSSPVKHADQASLEQGYRPHVNHHPYNSIRKMACNFGWDWGPDVATVGMWRPVRLENWSTARLASVSPAASVKGAGGVVRVSVVLEHSVVSSTQIVVSVASETQTVDVPAGEMSVVVDVEVTDVDLWWPRGHGAQPLYDLQVTLVSDGSGIDSWQGRVGFRTVRVDTEPDAHGTPFTLIINDRPIFVKGANWIPDDAFVHRVDRARYAARLAQAESANMNLLRVWGGGIYESDDFFDLCDERGILTWQDFLFACAAYAEEEPLRSEVEAEVRDNVVRLLPHPSLVVWNGSNENVWGHEEWGWAKRLRGRTWGKGYYDELLPELLRELDPHRPYTPSSPFSPDPAHFPNDPQHGSVHLWDLWNQRDYPHYRSYQPRFVAEYGWQGPPTWSTLTRSISDSPLTPESPGMLVHQKAMEGNTKLIDGLVDHLPLPDDTDDWHWAMSLNQARAIEVAIEHFRSLSPLCMGSIVWQLNDCWPVTSWAAVDGDGRAKPLLYAIKHAYEDRLVTIQPRESGLAVCVVNDTDQEWRDDVVIRLLSYNGEERASATVPLQLGARESATLTIPAEVATSMTPGEELVCATVGAVRALWFFAEYRDSELAAPRLTAKVISVSGGYEMRVRAENLVRDIALLVDKVDPSARVDDQLVTLLPGESVTFHVQSESSLNEGELITHRVLRSANQLVVGETAP